MDIFKKQDENFELFENFIRGLDDAQAKEFIIEFFKNYKYLLSQDIKRVSDDILLKVIEKKTIAVIGLDLHDIIEWRILSNFKIIGQQPAKKFKVGNTTYIGITKPEHVIGFKFDDIIQTANAPQNKDYLEIMTLIAPCLIDNIVNETKS